MQTKQLNSTQLSMVESNHSLSSYLSSLERGREETPHSWLYENESSDVTLKRWLSTLETVKDSFRGDEIYQFDYKQVEKFGPQGKVPPVQEGLATLEPSYAPAKFKAVKISDDLAKAIAKLMFGERLQTKRALSVESVVDDMRERDTLTTNSGCPLFARRNDKEVLEASIADAKSGKAYEYPAILLFRQYNGKLRPVWMYPMSLNLVEGSYTQPIQDALRNSPNDLIRDYVSPWRGFEDVKRKFTEQWRKHPFALGGDTTAMDANFRVDHSTVVYKVARYLFQESEWEGLYRSITSIHSIEVLVGPNAKLVGNHGVASGSGWTQLVETMYQMILFFLNKKHLETGQGIGDDFVWFADRAMDGKELATLLEEGGLPANPSKQSTEPDACTFLQRLFLRDYPSREDDQILGGIYPTVRALNASLNPEKYHNPKLWNSDMFCIRQYMILENTVDHPLFEEFVKFVVQGHKDLIPFAKLEASKLEAISKQARLIPGLNPTYNQEKREKPLAAFQSIQLAATL